ncbi:MAG: hypothetical protein R3B47_15445 [Bacteroidia bacterium]
MTISMLLIAIIAALALWLLPAAAAREAEAAFSRAQNIDSWESWSEFIETFPESPLTEKSRERQTLLIYGQIDRLILPSGDHGPL